MNSIAMVGLSVDVLVYLGSVAIASVVVCGAALSAVRGVRQWASLPVRHAIGVSALVATLASPLVVVLAGVSGWSLFHVGMGGAGTSVPLVENFAQNELLPRTVGSIDSQREVAPPTVPAAEAPTGREAAWPNVAAAPMQEQPTAPAKWSNWSWADFGRSLGTVLAVVWAGGCAMGLWRLAHGCVQLRRLVQRLEPVADRRIVEVANQAARQLGLRVPPTLRQSSMICGPLSVGLFRPLIMVPVAMTQSLTADQLRGMLLHELAHIVRRDHLVGLVQRSALILFWWNPLVRLLAARISALREQICDDLATRGVESADGYAAMLVELAGRVASIRPLPATIGILERPNGEFSDRVGRLLDDRRPIVTALDRPMKLATATTFAALVMLSGAVSIRVEAAGEPAPATGTVVADRAVAPADAKTERPSDEQETAPAVKWPPVLRGMIKDADGNPVAGAKVRLDLEKIHEYLIGRWDETLSSQEMVTGADGEYRFDTAEYPAMTHRPFMLMMSVTADGYADAKTWSWYSRRDTSVDEKWHDVTLLPGRVVRGRVVSVNGDPVPGAVVKATGDYDNQYSRSQSWNPRKTDEDGNFTISVPRDSEMAIELWVVSRDWAPQRVPIPKQGDVLADIRLQQGTRVSGIVTREDGTPVEGAVVVARSIDDGTLDKVTFAAQVAVKTDAKGRYQLPPLAGMYKIYLSQAEETDERLTGRFVVADGLPPLVAPVKVALSGIHAEPVDFHAGPTLTVRGTVRWPDGEPVDDCEVRASFMPPGFGTGIWLADTRTDAQGDYAVELPRPIDGISIFVSGHFDGQRSWHFAFPDDKVEADQKYMQNISFKRLEGDKHGVDWVLRPRDEVPGLRPVSKPDEKDAAELELEKLGRRYELQQQELRDALLQAKTPEEEHELFITLDPRIVLVDDYLALEEKHHGTNVGLAALFKVERFAASVSDRMPKLPAARREMLDRLMAHYLAHEDLDLMFGSLSSGPPTEKGPELLDRAAAESPHRHVQAAALGHLAFYRQQQADGAAQARMMLDELEHHTPLNQQSTDLLKKRIELLGEVDPVAARSDAIELCQRVVREYGGVREPKRMFDTSGRYWRADADHSDAVSNEPDYATIAKGLLFDLEHLQIGMPAPAVDGKDREGNAVQIKDYAGKVTVIAFVSFGHESLDAKLSDLMKQHTGQPLKIVKILSDPGWMPAASPGESPPLKPTIVEGHAGAVATQWSVHTWPTLFVIDHDGVIRARRLREPPSHMIGQLLEKAPAAGER